LVVVQFECLEVDAVFEAARFDLLESVAAEVEFLQTLQVAQEVQLGQAVVTQFESPELLEAGQLEAVQVEQ